ncbi:MAG: 50S ribosomal protein L22 [Candidatus Micrarchaeaceae archaeon]
MKYSYNLDSKGIVFASASDLNASFKDLCSVCDAVRYMPVQPAIKLLDDVVSNGRPIEYRRHNKYMGSRHELGGKKGRYPMKCAGMVRKVIVNAAANARNKGEDPDIMYIVHASANKTYDVPRAPPKGIRFHSGGYGYGTVRRSNLAFAKIEIGLADKDSEKLGARMKRALKAMSTKMSAEQSKEKAGAKVKPKPKPQQRQAKPMAAPQPEKKGKENVSAEAASDSSKV